MYFILRWFVCYFDANKKLWLCSSLFRAFPFLNAPLEIYTNKINYTNCIIISMWILQFWQCNVHLIRIKLFYFSCSSPFCCCCCYCHYAMRNDASQHKLSWFQFFHATIADNYEFTNSFNRILVYILLDVISIERLFWHLIDWIPFENYKNWRKQSFLAISLSLHFSQCYLTEFRKKITRLTFFHPLFISQFDKSA